MQSIIVLDTETSDLDPEKGAALLELAWIRLQYVEGDGQHVEGRWWPHSSGEDYVIFEGEMNPAARAIHHIRPDQLTAANGASPRQEVVNKLLRIADIDTVFVAHNYEFDVKFVPEIKGPWVCTFRCAKAIWPDAPGHSNQTLRYWLNIEPAIENTMHRHPHQALYDVAVTAGILLKMLEEHDLNKLVKLTSGPIQLKRMPFGKHRGVEMDMVPRDYLRWLNDRNDLDADMRYTLDSMGYKHA